MNHRVCDLPAPLGARLAGCPLIVFDGECVLCSNFYRFVLRHDHAHHFAFATAQSPIGQQLYRALDLSPDEFETNLVVAGGRIYSHLDSFAVVMRHLPRPWPLLGFLHVLPPWLKTPLYRLVARNRYRLFGRYDTCQLPDGAAQARFISGGW